MSGQERKTTPFPSLVPGDDIRKGCIGSSCFHPEEPEVGYRLAVFWLPVGGLPWCAAAGVRASVKLYSSRPGLGFVKFDTQLQEASSRMRPQGEAVDTGVCDMLGTKDAESKSQQVTGLTLEFWILSYGEWKTGALQSQWEPTWASALQKDMVLKVTFDWLNTISREVGSLGLPGVWGKDMPAFPVPAQSVWSQTTHPACRSLCTSFLWLVSRARSSSKAMP